MEQYTVTGMSCAACQARVEKAVLKVPGVTACSVSLLTNSMGVEGEAAGSEIIKAVESAGYGAAVKGASEDEGAAKQSSLKAKLAVEEEALRDRQTPLLKKRLIASAGFLIVLMYFSMGHMMFGFPLPRFFQGNHVAVGILQLLLSGIILVFNRQFFISGFTSLLHGAPNMDTLIALGSAAAYGYSTAVLFVMTDAVVKGDEMRVMSCMEDLYFESAAMILTLITVGKMLEAYSKGKTTDALKSLMKLAPETATLIRDGAEVTVPVDEVVSGDIFTVRPGESIPVDGIVLEGNSAVDESALTGESIPVDKEEGSTVSSATINRSGFLKCRATRVGEDTSLARIIQMVSDAAATKAPVAKLADRISGVFVPAVMALAVLTTLIWLLAGQDTGFALSRGICVLVVSCPCALGLATPVAIMVGNGVGAKNGILFKTAQALQETGNTQIVALDKTGTVTYGEPAVTDVISAPGYLDTQLIRLANALESKSEHPLAGAVTAFARENGVKDGEVTDFEIFPGNGLKGTLDGEVLYGGNRSFISRKADIPEDMAKEAERLSAEGKTPLFFAKDSGLIGIIAVADTIRKDSRQAISQLQGMGIRVVMLTGDNERTAEAIGREAGVDEVIAGVLPDGKENVIRSLQKDGRTAMVGDGINDAPALTAADTGIAIKAGTDVAVDAADVVLMKNSLLDVPAAIRLSRQTYRNIVENLFWALFYNTLLIPLAAGAYAKAFGLTMNPMFGAAAMSLSSFCVVMNALRLNLFRLYDASKDRPLKKKTPYGGKPTNDTAAEAAPKRKESEMTRTLKIDGMMCAHCEASVKKALEALDGVQSAEVSHEAGTAVVTLNGAVGDADLKKAVEDREYTVTGIE